MMIDKYDRMCEGLTSLIADFSDLKVRAYAKSVYSKPGYVDKKAERELNEFLLQWLKNLKIQEHHLTKG